MNIIMAIVEKVIKAPLINTLASRLINRYTSSGIIIVLMQLENLEILPKGVSKAVDGLPAREILLYIGLAVGAYLIMHKPRIKSKLKRKKEELEIKQIELEIEEIEKKIKERKENGNR